MPYLRYDDGSAGRVVRGDESTADEMGGVYEIAGDAAYAAVAAVNSTDRGDESGSYMTYSTDAESE